MRIPPFALLLLCGATATLAGAAPPTPGEPCWYSTLKEGMAEHADCLRRGKDGRPYVDSRRAREMELEAYGLAAVHGERLGWMYVDRRGKVVVAGVALFDNGADPWKNGRVRIRRGDKWGFADPRGREVIPPVYDGALPFEKGRARVCRGCRQTCADPGCEIHLFVGGEWLCIDPRGRPAAGCGS